MSRLTKGIELANDVQDLTLQLNHDQSSDTAKLLLTKMQALNALHPHTFSQERLAQIEQLIDTLKIVKH